MEDGSHLTLLCETRAGYRNLCRLITAAHAGTRPRQGADPLPPVTTYAALERHAEGLVCLSGCARHGALARAVEAGRHAEAAAAGRRLLRDLRARRACGSSSSAPSPATTAAATGCWPSWPSGSGCRPWPPATCTPTAARAPGSRTRWWRCAWASTLDECEPWRRGNSSHALAPPEAMAERFAEHPDAVAETARLAERLRFDLTSDLGYAYPGSEDPEADAKLARHLRDRAWRSATRAGSARARAEARLRGGAARDPPPRPVRLLPAAPRHARAGARGGGGGARDRTRCASPLPPGRGRGSSVASIVCYLTGLSHIDPLDNELHLGRFLNEDLTALPDIDLDFPRDIREVLIPRVHERYGHERSALVAAFATYQVRSAVRDFAKALGLPPGRDRAAGAHGGPVAAGQRHRARRGRGPGGPRAARRAGRRSCTLARAAAGLPRHQSQHPGGMVISTQPLIDLCPIQPAAMEGRQMVQWDKDSCADAGFLKIDLLGLGMLSAVERCVEEIARTRNERIDLSRIDFDDQEVYDEIQEAETMGVFQIESRAQMSDAAAHPARVPRRPDRAGGAGAPGADPGRRGAPLHRAQEGAARGPRLPGALRAPVARAGAARHARRDRLPGPGDRGGDGLRRLLRRARPRGCGGR